MLVDHTDAHINGADGPVDLYRLPMEQDIPLLMGFHTEKHFHQGAFPGPILADQRVDLPLTDRQIHILVGYKAV